MNVPSEILDRAPPNNLAAERSVIGSIMLDAELFDDVTLLLTPADFYAPAHQTLYRRLSEMHATGKPIDAMLLIDRLKAESELETIGGTAYLTEIVQAVPTAAHAVHYAKIVREKSILRELRHAGENLCQLSNEAGADPDEQLAKAERKIFAIAERRYADAIAPLPDVLMQAIAAIEARADRGTSGLATGYADLDRQTGGLVDGELTILAARPSMGKTALAVNIADNVASRGLGVLFVSLEMSRLSLAERLLSWRAKVSGEKLRNSTLNGIDSRAIVEASNGMAGHKLYIDDTSSRNMTEIAAQARRTKRREGLALVVVDYIQLIQAENSKENREQQVSLIARRLKGLARELSVPVMCLAQLNREAEKSVNNKPKLSHLRESGAIEQDADMVWFVHRPEYYATDEATRDDLHGKAEIVVAKNRNGRVGSVNMTWLSQFTRFESAAKAPEPSRDFMEQFA